MTDQGVLVRDTVPDRATTFERLGEGQLVASYRLAAVLLRDRIEAEDAVQDALLRAWHGWPRLRDPARVEAWFQRILVNGCRDRLRQRKHWARVAQLPERSGPDEHGRSDERAALLQAIDSLPVDQRVVVVLRYFGDLPLEQIAERTGSRAGTVKSRLHHGLRALRAAYEAAGRPTAEVDR
jgi:RNA polymerase sigma-70 factor (sigma-E family)